MKVKVDQKKCIGCGACVAISEKNFDFNDEGLSMVKDETVYDTTRDAVDACPVYAISIEEDDKQECECEHKKCECEHCSCEEDKEKEAA